MTKPLRTLFLIADGGCARWVARDNETGDFRTLRERHAHDHAAHAYSGAVFESATGERHGVREPHESARRNAEMFAAEVAARLDGVDERLVIVAPPRMLNAIEAALPAAARKQLAGRLAKDLTKVADHDLARWLVPLEL